MTENLPTFAFVEASSIEDACSRLAESGEAAQILAGGTDLLPRMKYRAVEPGILISLGKVPGLRGIEKNSDGGIRIGPLTKLHEIETSPLLRQTFPLLSQAASRVANRLLRNMGTLGGNICSEARCDYYNHSNLFSVEYWPRCFKRQGNRCHVVPGGTQCYARYAADTAPALIALGATLRIASIRGEKTIPVENFFTGKGEPVNILQPDEFLAEILIPPAHPGCRGVYLKHSYRETTDYPVVGVAVSANFEGAICRDIRIVAVAVGSAPVRMREIEELLEGSPLSESASEKAAEMAGRMLKPLPHQGDAPGYVKEMAGVYTKRALMQLVSGNGCQANGQGAG